MFNLQLQLRFIAFSFALYYFLDKIVQCVFGQFAVNLHEALRETTWDLHTAHGTHTRAKHTFSWYRNTPPNGGDTTTAVGRRI